LFTAFGVGVGKDSQGKTIALNPNLFSAFQAYLSNVALWLWGHEHNFDFFNPYIGLKKGRCVGASAIPNLVAQNPYGKISNPDLQGQSGLPTQATGMLDLSVTSDGTYYHNYAIVTLRGPGSEFQDSKIEYYELDSANQGPSILMGGEIIP
jgi:hypothetical protein